MRVAWGSHGGALQEIGMESRCQGPGIIDFTIGVIKEDFVKKRLEERLSHTSEVNVGRNMFYLYVTGETMFCGASLE